MRTVELAGELFGEAATMQLLRVIGSSVSRVADAAVSTFITTIGAASVAGGSDDDSAPGGERVGAAL